VRHIADRIAVMYLGRIVETASKRPLFAAPRHPYTQGLLAAIPLPEPGLARERRLVGGDVPSPLAPPSGCHFHTRCPHARARCSAESPALAFEGGHGVACHFWKDIAAPVTVQPSSAAATPARLRLARLQAAFNAAPASAAAPALTGTPP